MDPNKKMRKFEGTCYIPGEQLAMMAKYYRGANLNLNLTLFEEDLSSTKEALDTCWCSNLDDDERRALQRMRGGEDLHWDQRREQKLSLTHGSDCAYYSLATGFPPLKSLKGGDYDRQETRESLRKSDALQADDERVFTNENRSTGYSKRGNSILRAGSLNGRYDARRRSHETATSKDCGDSLFAEPNVTNIECAICSRKLCAVCKSPLIDGNCKCVTPNAGFCRSCLPASHNEERQNPKNWLNLLFFVMGLESGKQFQTCECIQRTVDDLYGTNSESSSSSCSCNDTSTTKSGKNNMSLTKSGVNKPNMVMKSCTCFPHSVEKVEKETADDSYSRLAKTEALPQIKGSIVDQATNIRQIKSESPPILSKSTGTAARNSGDGELPNTSTFHLTHIINTDCIGDCADITSTLENEAVQLDRIDPLTPPKSSSMCNSACFRDSQESNTATLEKPKHLLKPPSKPDAMTAFPKVGDELEQLSFGGRKIVWSHEQPYFPCSKVIVPVHMRKKIAEGIRIHDVSCQEETSSKITEIENNPVFVNRHSALILSSQVTSSFDSEQKQFGTIGPSEQSHVGRQCMETNAIRKGTRGTKNVGFASDVIPKDRNRFSDPTAANAPMLPMKIDARNCPEKFVGAQINTNVGFTCDVISKDHSQEATGPNSSAMELAKPTLNFSEDGIVDQHQDRTGQRHPVNKQEMITRSVQYSKSAVSSCRNSPFENSSETNYGRQKEMWTQYSQQECVEPSTLQIARSSPPSSEDPIVASLPNESSELFYVKRSLQQTFRDLRVDESGDIFVEPLRVESSDDSIRLLVMQVNEAIERFSSAQRAYRNSHGVCEQGRNYSDINYGMGTPHPTRIDANSNPTTSSTTSCEHNLCNCVDIVIASSSSGLHNCSADSNFYSNIYENQESSEIILECCTSQSICDETVVDSKLNSSEESYPSAFHVVHSPDTGIASPSSAYTKDDKTSSSSSSKQPAARALKKRSWMENRSAKL